MHSRQPSWRLRCPRPDPRSGTGYFSNGRGMFYSVYSVRHKRAISRDTYLSLFTLPPLQLASSKIVPMLDFLGVMEDLADQLFFVTLYFIKPALETFPDMFNRCTASQFSVCTHCSLSILWPETNCACVLLFRVASFRSR